MKNNMSSESDSRNASIIVEEWKDALAEEIVEGKREILKKFFKTGAGEYGEGDVFIGVPVPGVRKVSKLMTEVPCEALEKMLESEIHEHRLSALLVLVEKYRKERKREEVRQNIVDFYLAHTRGINNWDLVDLSASKIIGEYVLATGRYDLLDKLSHSDNLWEQRIAVVSNWTLIKHGVTEPATKICARFISHKHDLIHKATGWMLREVYGRGYQREFFDFMDRFAYLMPRTMLRYAIEKLPETQRKYYLSCRKAK